MNVPIGQIFCFFRTYKQEYKTVAMLFGRSLASERLSFISTFKFIGAHITRSFAFYMLTLAKGG